MGEYILSEKVLVREQSNSINCLTTKQGITKKDPNHKITFSPDEFFVSKKESNDPSVLVSNTKSSPLVISTSRNSKE